MAKQLEVGVVLQGGGALGAYECGALGALMELMDAHAKDGRDIKLKVVTGVSIGAINGACVVGASDFLDARDRLNALWDELTLRSLPFWPGTVQRDAAYFGLPGFNAARSDFWNVASWTHVYDTSALIRTLTTHVDFEALNASPTAFVVTAVDVTGGTLKPFASKKIGDHAQTAISPQHVRASGSLPPGFPWTVIDNTPYWDGGIVENAPLGIAIDAFSTADDVEHMLVVINLYPLRARLPINLASVQDRAHELSFGNRLRQDQDTARRINALVETIGDLAALVKPEDRDARLQARIDEARRYKIIETIVNIDVQDPTVTPEPAVQHISDDQDGGRDFSADTVNRRRKDGYALAQKILTPAFETIGNTSRAAPFSLNTASTACPSRSSVPSMPICSVRPPATACGSPTPI